VHGHHRGRGLGFPTANLVTDKELLPRDGVYAVKVRVDDQLLDGACNIGTNPTFGDGPRAIEVFILDHGVQLYGEEVRLYFMDRIRDEQAFDSRDELMAAITRDVARCRQILAGAVVIGYRDYLGRA
jgi:riboflavin kinase/FMN adenylyltransferase